MFLQKIELQGFKSFASKTILTFLGPKNSSQGIAAVVGPNGSGKSNIADAIRWVMGEQSMKILRGKKSEDVIFSGSDKKARLGFGEVSLYLNNEDHTAPIDFDELVITRRLYRSGESEYVLNNRTVRLSDITLLLARSHVGERSYSVIGQGMIDAMLVASPNERKEFFDEAAGIREFQIKRHQAELKLNQTRLNLQEAQMIVAEITPRFRSLDRQMKRAEKREETEQELANLQKKYYGGLWFDLNARHQELVKREAIHTKELKDIQEVYQALLEKLRTLEKEEVLNPRLLELQNEYEQAQTIKHQLTEEHMQFARAIEIAKVRSEVHHRWTPLPISKIIHLVEEIVQGHQALLVKIRSVRSLHELADVVLSVEQLETTSAGLLKHLQEPAEEPEQQPTDSKQQERLEEIKKAVVTNELRLTEIRDAIHVESKQQQQKKGIFFELQRKLQENQSKIHAIEQQMNTLQIELARVETRRDALQEEMQREVSNQMSAITHQDPDAIEIGDAQELQPKIYHLKHQLELIGTIDAETREEHVETKKRFEFLEFQIADLTHALEGTEQVIAELDAIMKERRAEAFERMNKEFNRYFQILFHGGRAELLPIRGYENEEEELEGEDVEEKKRPTREKQEMVLLGIDIRATPPGKRIKDVTVLSGGERAMTAVALMCAILTCNPSPFVVLDEVDAALDEANSIRFASIIEELSVSTQFIVITHNRATMEKAGILYGVTMGDDGISKLLSINLEQAEQWGNRK